MFVCNPVIEQLEVRSDKYKLRSALVKLIDNAIKFTSNGSVSLTCMTTGSDLLYVVSDTGPAIPPDRQKAVFESFVQADLEITRPHEGAGIGLSFAKAYAEMLGGKLWLESEVGKGTKVYLKITYQNPTKNFFLCHHQQSLGHMGIAAANDGHKNFVTPLECFDHLNACDATLVLFAGNRPIKTFSTPL